MTGFDLQWLSLHELPSHGLRARAIRVSWQGQALARLRFARSVAVPETAFLAHDAARVPLALQMGGQVSQPRALPGTAGGLVRYLLTAQADKALHGAAVAAHRQPSDGMGELLLGALVGVQMAGMLRSMEQSGAFRADEGAWQAWLGQLLSMPPEAGVLWNYLQRHGAQRLVPLLAPLLEPGCFQKNDGNGLAPQAWIRTATGRRDVVERGRHFPAAWIAAAAAALPVVGGMVRRLYFARLFDSLRALRGHLEALEDALRLGLVEAAAKLAARSAGLAAAPGALAQQALAALRLDAAGAISGAALAAAAAGSTRTALPAQLVLRMLVLATGELHRIETEHLLQEWRQNFHRILDWMGAATSINHDMLRAASFAGLADEALLWRLLMEDGQRWHCVLLHSEQFMEPGTWHIDAHGHAVTLTPICNEEGLTWIGQAFDNCLATPRMRRKYRIACLRGIARTFMISTDKRGLAGVLTLLWKDGAWFCAEAQGPRNSALPPVFYRGGVIEAFVAAYNRLRPTPYPVEDTEGLRQELRQ